LPSACGIRKLTSLLSDFFHGKIFRTKAEKLKDLAKNSIACYNSGNACELSLTVERILFLEKQKVRIEDKIRVVMLELNSCITSIPGICVILGCYLSRD
jgi:UDP-N-acetylmuramyl pentapeptide synthase